MPRYLVKFVLETPVYAPKNIIFKHGGWEVEFLFETRIDQSHLFILATSEGVNWREAIDNAMQNTVSPVLDAIALHKKAPAMLLGPVEVVKAESGKKRRAVLIENQQNFHKVELDAIAVEEIDRLLTTN